MFKIGKKVILFVSAIASAIVVSPILTSCSLFMSQTVPNSMQKFMKSSPQLHWISERSLSLKFNAENGSVGYGTGWIMGRNKNKHSTYYVATNLHVASFIANQGHQFYEKTGDIYTKSNPSPKYYDLEIGIVGTEKDDQTFEYGTSESLKKYSDGGIHFISTVNVKNDTRIAFAGYQTYENMLSLPDDPYNIRHEKIINGTLDLAVIEIDFSNFNAINGYERKVMNGFLSNYDKNPTKFAKEPGESFTNLFIGGFPYQNKELNPPNWATGLPHYPIWVGLSNINLSNKTTGYSLPISAPSNMERPYYDAAIINEIKYNAKSFGSFRNVAFQGLVNGIDLGGGSSGSMVVNSNNEVIGIYWGTYTLNGSSSGKRVVGGFDYLYSSRSYRVKAANGQTAICHSYNAVESMERIIGTSNLANTIWS